jgi:hypothetical protein
MAKLQKYKQNPSLNPNNNITQEHGRSKPELESYINQLALFTPSHSLIHAVSLAMAATTILLLLFSATVATAGDLPVQHNVHPSSPSPLEAILSLARDDDARLLLLSSKAIRKGGTSAPV